MSVTSTPFLNVTPWMTLGNWFSPFSRRQVLAAAMTSLNTISRAVSRDRAPLVRTVRCRTAAKTLSTGLDVRRGRGRGQLAHHRPGRVLGWRALGPDGAVPHGGEDALERVGRAQVVPVLG